jgi:hypothetical protein
VRNLGVRLKIDIGRGEYDPFPVRRRHRLVHAFEFHHVLKGEGMLSCTLSQERGAKEKGKRDEYFHVQSFYFVIPSEVEESLTVVWPLFDQKYLEMSPLRST